MTIKQQTSCKFFEFSSVAAMVRADLLIIVRDPTILVGSIVLLAFSLMLAPAASAPYAVISVNGMKPIMSASPALFTMGVLFSLCMFPVAVIYLGRAYGYDRRNGIRELYLSSPMSFPGRAFCLAVARLLSAGIVCFVVIIIIMMLCAISVRLRAGTWPSLDSAMSCLAIVVPVIVAIATIATTFSAFIWKTTVRIILTLCAWLSLVVWPMFGNGPDLFGIRFIGENIAPGQTKAALSVGFIEGNISTIQWEVLRESRAHLIGQLYLLLSIVVIAAIICGAIAFAYRWMLASHHYSSKAPAQIQGYEQRPSNLSPVRLRTNNPTALRVIWINAVGFLQRSKLTKMLMVATGVIALGSGHASYAFPVALLIPLTLVRNRPRRMTRPERVVQLTTPSLWSVTPTLILVFAISLLTMIPVTLIVLRNHNDALALIQFAVVVLAMSGWLAYTHESTERETLGKAVYIITWYCFGCNSLPASADLFAIHGFSVVPFIIDVVVAVLVGIIVVRYDHV